VASVYKLHGKTALSFAKQGCLLPTSRTMMESSSVDASFVLGLVQRGAWLSRIQKPCPEAGFFAGLKPELNLKIGHCSNE
jgi:hypothetical protein